MNIDNLPRIMWEGFVLVKHTKEKKVGSLVVLEDKTQNPIMTAEVYRTDETSSLEEGYKVLVNSNAGVTVTQGGEEYLIIREKGNVFAVL